MDHLQAMRAFVAVVQTGSFSQAALRMHLTQSTISKWVAHLEDHTHVRLIQRTTRVQQLTPAGQIFYDSALDILAKHDETLARLSATTGSPIGTVRLSAPVVFGQRFVMPLLPAFLARHPQVEVEVSLSDRYINLVEQGVDLALRLGQPVDSTLRAKTLGHSPRILVATPAYLDHHGPLQTPADLVPHACLAHAGRHTPDAWSFRGPDGQSWLHRPRGRLRCDHSGGLLDMVFEHQGLTLIAQCMVRDSLASGELEHVLQDFDAGHATLQLLRIPSPYPKAQVQALMETLGHGLGALVS